MSERSFTVSGEALDNPTTLEAVQDALAGLAAEHNLHIEFVRPKEVDPDTMWQHDPAGLSPQDFYQLTDLYSSNYFQRHTITRALNAANRYSSRTEGVLRAENGDRLVSRRAVQGLIEVADRGDGLVGLGKTSLEVLRAVIAHTRPSEAQFELSSEADA